MSGESSEFVCIFVFSDKCPHCRKLIRTKKDIIKTVRKSFPKTTFITCMVDTKNKSVNYGKNKELPQSLRKYLTYVPLIISMDYETWGRLVSDQPVQNLFSKIHIMGYSKENGKFVNNKKWPPSEIKNYVPWLRSLNFGGPNYNSNGAKQLTNPFESVNQFAGINETSVGHGLAPIF